MDPVIVEVDPLDQPLIAPVETPTLASAAATSVTQTCVLARIVGELSATERSYLSSIECLQARYIQPLVRDAKLAKELALTEQARGIWEQAQGAIEPMVKLHHEVNADCAAVAAFAASSEATPAETVARVADIFIHRAPYFKLYTAYVDSYLSCLSVLPNMPTLASAPQGPAAADKKKFVRWAEAQSVASGNGQNLQSLLIMPVQRAPRYELLLNAIDKEYEDERKKVTPGSDAAATVTAAWSSLTQARASIKDLNSKLNEWKRESENKQRLWTLSQTLLAKGLQQEYNILESHRKYVADVVVTQVHPNPTARKPLHLWLTSDVLILVSAQKSKLKGWIEIADLVSVTSHDATTPELSIHSAKLEAPEKCLSLESMSSTATPTSFFTSTTAAPVPTATSRRRTFTPQAPRSRKSRFSFFAASPPPVALPAANGSTPVPVAESSPTASPPSSSPSTLSSSPSASPSSSPTNSSSSWITFEFVDVSQKSKWAGLLNAAIEAHAANSAVNLRSPTMAPMSTHAEAAVIPPASLDAIPSTPTASSSEPPLKKQRLTPPAEEKSRPVEADAAASNRIEQYVVPSAKMSRRSIGQYSPESFLPSIPLEDSYHEDELDQDQEDEVEKNEGMDDSFDMPMPDSAVSRPAQKRSPSRSLARELSSADDSAACVKPTYRASPAMTKRRHSRTNAVHLSRAQRATLEFIVEDHSERALDVSGGSLSHRSTRTSGGGSKRSSCGSKRSSSGNSATQSETSFADVQIHVDPLEEAATAAGGAQSELMFSPARTALALAALPCPISPIPVETFSREGEGEGEACVDGEEEGGMPTFVEALDAPILIESVTASPTISSVAVPALQLELVPKLALASSSDEAAVDVPATKATSNISKKRAPSASPARTARNANKKSKEALTAEEPSASPMKNYLRARSAKKPEASPAKTARSLKKEPESSPQRTSRKCDTVAPTAAATASGSLSGRKRARSTVAPAGGQTARARPTLPASSAASNLPLSTPVDVPSTPSCTRSTASSRNKQAEKAAVNPKRPVTAAKKKNRAAPVTSLAASPSTPMLEVAPLAPMLPSTHPSPQFHHERLPSNLCAPFEFHSQQPHPLSPRMLEARAQNTPSHPISAQKMAKASNLAQSVEQALFKDAMVTETTPQPVMVVTLEGADKENCV
jgi:hypothetical protein